MASIEKFLTNWWLILTSVGRSGKPAASCGTPSPPVYHRRRIVPDYTTQNRIPCVCHGSFKCHFLHCDQMPCCQQLGLSRIGTTDLGYCAGARVTSVVAMSNSRTSGDQVTPTSWCNPFIYVVELPSARGINNSVPFVLFTKSYGQTQFYVAAAYYLKVSLFTL